MRQPDFYNLRRAEMPLTTVQQMRARHALLSAGRYLQNQYNFGMAAGDLNAWEQIALWQAAEIVAQKYNALTAN